MTNTSTDQNKTSSDENKVKLLWEILKPYKDKYLQVWWYGGWKKEKAWGSATGPCLIPRSFRRF